MTQPILKTTQEWQSYVRRLWCNYKTSLCLTWSHSSNGTLVIPYMDKKIYPYHVVYCSRCFATQQTTHKSIVTIPVFITPRLNQLPLTGELVYHWTQFTNACGARVRKRAEKGTAVTLTWCSHLDKMDFEGFLEAYDAISGQGLSNKLQTTNVIQSNRYKVQYISLNVSIT